MTPLLAQRPGADRSFERLYRRHAGDVYRYALALLRDASDAEDVTQTAFLNAYAALQRGDEPGSPRRWLVSITHDVCRRRVGGDEPPLDDEPEPRLGLEDVSRAVGRLPLDQRAALAMRELEGRSHAEIAGELELPVAAVEALLFRARRSVREHLDDGLACGEAERAFSNELDGRLPSRERIRLDEHLRECLNCAAAARSMRRQRGAIRSLGAVPLPPSLALEPPHKKLKTGTARFSAGRHLH